MRVFSNLDEFAAATGEHLGYSQWHTITQHQVDTFADATGDHQWIHVDPDKAKHGPFGTTIAHGYLTLALLPMLNKEIYQVRSLSMGINYGLNKVRFPQPVAVGSAVRAGAELRDTSDVDGGKQALVLFTIDIDGQSKPACIAESVSRLLR